MKIFLPSDIFFESDFEFFLVYDKIIGIKIPPMFLSRDLKIEKCACGLFS